MQCPRCNSKKSWALSTGLRCWIYPSCTFFAILPSAENTDIRLSLMKYVDGRLLFLLISERYFLFDFPNDFDPNTTRTEGLQREAHLRQGILSLSACPPSKSARILPYRAAGQVRFSRCVEFCVCITQFDRPG